jgi:serine/threonine-protein kinase
MQHAVASNPDASGAISLGAESTGMMLASTSQSMPAAYRTVTDVSARGHRSKGMFLGIAIGMILFCGLAAVVGFVLVRRAPAATTATPAPAAPKGSLEISSDPPGASIWINGDLRAETTPATIAQLPVGVALDVKLTMDGYEHAKRSVTLEDGKPAEPVRVELRKGSVVLDVKIAPDGLAATTMTLDGKPVKGPRIEGVTSGVSHKLVVTAPGYADGVVTFTGNPLETKRVEVSLEKLPEPRHGGPIRVSNPPATAPQAPVGTGKLNVGASGGWCNVTVDGAPRGATPVAGLELSAGPHRVTCTTADGKAQQATVTVPTDGTARYKFTL